MMNIFTDEGDHPFYRILLKKKSKFIISFKAQNLISKEDMIIAFASFTRIRKNIMKLAWL